MFRCFWCFSFDFPSTGIALFAISRVSICLTRPSYSSTPLTLLYGLFNFRKQLDGGKRITRPRRGTLHAHTFQPSELSILASAKNFFDLMSQRFFQIHKSCASRNIDNSRQRSSRFHIFPGASYSYQPRLARAGLQAANGYHYCAGNLGGRRSHNFVEKLTRWWIIPSAQTPNTRSIEWFND